MLLSISKEMLLDSYLSEYIRIFLIDLEEDRFYLLYEREKDPEIEELMQQADGCYSEMNRLRSRQLSSPGFIAWREGAGSRENIRAMLQGRSSFSFLFPLREKDKWRKLQARSGQRQSLCTEKFSKHRQFFCTAARSGWARTEARSERTLRIHCPKVGKSAS